MNAPTRVRTAGAILRALLPVVLVSCAGQAPPPGGPEDRIPPEIISTSPAPYSTYYSERVVALEFSEYVERRSVEGAIFVSPDVGRLEFDWSGQEVEITFADSLKPNTTYVVTVGTDVVDLRNRNRMARAFSIAFSTGGQIDRAAIAGIVYPESGGASKSGVLVGAYRLDDLDPDTLNPRWTKPDYVTQTGSAGEFALPHLRFGRYRLLALRDEYTNLLYDPQTDAYGVLAGEVELSEADTLVRDLAIAMAVEDTTAPTLIKATARSLQQVELQFSEPLRESDIPVKGVEARDTLSGASLEVLAVSMKHPERDRYLLASAPQDSMAIYRLTVVGVRDSAGNDISPIANSLTFQPNTSSDTVGFRIVGFSTRDSSRSVARRPMLEAYFSRPADRSIPPRSVVLSDTLGRALPLDVSWSGSLTLSVQPRRSLSHEAWYRLTIFEGMLSDVFGARGRDTTIAIAFQVVSADRLGSIEGTAIDESTSDSRGPIVVFAQPVDGSRGETIRQTIDGPGPFVLSEVPEGQYRIGGYRDRNGNALYDAGAVFPYTPAERFRLVADTLRVRARWPYEGAVLRLR